MLADHNGGLSRLIWAQVAKPEIVNTILPDAKRIDSNT